MSRLRFDNLSSDDVEYVAMLGVAAFEKPVIDVNHMRAEMMNDQMCKKLCERIRTGNWKKCTEMEQPFMKKSDALTVQNDLIYMLYADIERYTEGEGIVDIRRRCKLHYGVPILRAHDEEFRKVYDKSVKPLPYEDKLEIMDFLPVTSRMKKPQATEYIETIMREYSQRGVQFQIAA